jgi:hypothetical protein
MKLKLLLMLLSASLLSLSSCRKKDTPKAHDPGNIFAGTQWEYSDTRTSEENNEPKTYTEVIHFVDDTYVTYSSTIQIIQKDGSLKRQTESPVVKTTYTYQGNVAKATFAEVENGKLVKQVTTMTIDATKQKLTASTIEEGETLTAEYIRKK